MSNLYLQHHGVLGMKWGVRKDRSKARIIRPKGKAEVDKVLSKIGKTKLQNAHLNGISDLTVKLPRLKGSIKQTISKQSIREAIPTIVKNVLFVIVSDLKDMMSKLDRKRWIAI